MLNKYYIHVNGWVYAMTCYGFGERDARARFRHQHGFTRLPNGTVLWKAV